jgi:hypothetical protein
MEFLRQTGRFPLPLGHPNIDIMHSTKSENPLQRFTKSITVLINKRTEPMDTRTQAKLIEFLTEELAVPSGAIAMALRHQDHAANPLPMVLWQYGLITLEQLDRIFDWMESV